MYYALTYQLCDNYMEKRTAHRSNHFDLIQEYKSNGYFLMGGAFENQKSALLIFTVDNEKRVEDFINSDPYVINGVVTSWNFEKWNMVTGDVVLKNEN